MKKKLIITAGAVALVAAGAFAAFRFTGQSNAAPSTAVVQAAEVEAQPQTGAIVVDGRVVPVLRSDLSLPVSGVLAELLVKEGDQVDAGQALLRLKATQQESAVAQAEAQLAGAQARLKELQAGARKQEVAAATAVRDATQARLERIQKGPLPAEIAVARAGLAEAQASLQSVLNGTSDQQLIAAQAELANAEAGQRRAQAAYDRVAGDPEIGARPEALQLEQATNATTAARARLDDLKQGASASDVAAARARVQRAQAQLDLLSATNPADVAEAEAAVRQAQAQLDLTEAGVRPEAIAVAEADVEAAQVAVAQATSALEDTILRAPFAGSVASLDISLGEQVAAGSPVLRLADLSRWQIETEDLTEFDVVGLRAGDPVALTFDAIPDLKKNGVISRIRPIGENNRGDIVYTLVIDPGNQDERLLWNMTAVVTIER
jgi:multidrug efflux pump subunit AcrA (membrane-fusion protein)